MNFISTFDELNKLYEEKAEKVEEACTKEALTEETVEEEEIEIVDDEAPADEAVVEEPKQTILECSKCGALVIVDEVVVDEESDLVNVADACKFCEEKEGYKIVGSVVPYISPDAEEYVEEAPVEEGLTEEVSTEDTTSTDDELEEGIFDSKATKQKRYEELIKGVFGRDKSSTGLANHIATEAADLLTDSCTTDLYSRGETGATTNQMAGTLQLLQVAMTNIGKHPRDLLSKILKLGRQYGRNSAHFEAVEEFERNVSKLQTSGKDGYKAMEFLFSKLNPVLTRKVTTKINYLKKNV